MSRQPLFSCAAVASILLVAGCNPPHHVATGPTRHDPLDIELGKAERANIELNVGAGELNAKAGTDKLVSGTFTYNVDELKPIVESSTNGSHSIITIREPNRGHMNMGHVENTWDLNLNDHVLWDVTVNCGAGQARLDLGALNLRSLAVHLGVGQVDLNLEGAPKRDYDVNISGGVGQATVRLPKNVGISAEAHGGIGSIDVTGLEKKGDHYENGLYDKAKVNLHVKVQGGIGEIRLIG
jgi:hypothetical protein